MRKLIIAAITVLALAITPVALGHPSENRAEQSLFGGPHCHINLMSGRHAFPSHRAHIATGLADGIFTAAACPE